LRRRRAWIERKSEVAMVPKAVMAVAVVVVGTVAVAGCGPSKKPKARAGTPTVFPLGDSRASESRIWIETPSGRDTAVAPETMVECRGALTLKEGHQLIFPPVLSLMRKNVTFNQARAVLGERRPDGSIPFQGALPCRDRPGDYTIVAQMSLFPPGELKADVEPSYAKSPPVPLRVNKPEPETAASAAPTAKTGAKR
jgi:hypothetical protein